MRGLLLRDDETPSLDLEPDDGFGQLLRAAVHYRIATGPHAGGKAITRFLDDGRICLTNNAVERALRGIALGRRSWLFAGSERGGERAAAMYTLIVTAKLNDVDPQAWLADVLARIAELPHTRVHELLPWNWKAARNQDLAAQAGSHLTPRLRYPPGCGTGLTSRGPLRMLTKGLIFVGLDVIGDYLTEINVTSPTCVRELDAAFGADIAGQLMSAIEARLAAR